LAFVDTVFNVGASARSQDWETIPEVVQTAFEQLPPHVWDYSCGGCESETTLRRNRSAYEYLAFRPRVLRDVRQRDISTTFLGVELSLPVMLAPVGSIALFDAGGALTCARAAEAVGTAAFVGTVSSPSLEAVSEGSHGPLFFQLYLTDVRERTEALVRRAEAAGYKGICLTVDSAVYGRRERDIHNRFRPREREKPNVPGMSTTDADLFRAGASWDDLEWLCDITPLPVMVKGITNADDAALAVEHGARAVYVSNHGGRQLDHNAATVEVLPEIVASVADRAEVIADGGVLRGTDVLKMLALGARAVLIGRLMAWGLAAGGQAGLVRTLEILRTEIEVNMANLGVTRLSELSPSLLRPTVPPLRQPWPTSLRGQATS
jgi:isopentenyl diphosphate isomerase/L-lactate dehydrogenase-like FMN-dependent dehydrogenase